MSISVIIENIGLIVISITAIYGINSWKREFRGKRKMELAEDVLTLFYEAQAAIHHMRNPLAGGSEGKSREREDLETEDQSLLRDRAFVLIERYLRYEKTFSRIQSLRFRFMATFGKDTIKPFDELNMIVSQIILAAKRLPGIWEKSETDFEAPIKGEGHLTRRARMESFFYEDLEEKDEVLKKLNAVISSVETTCSKAISKGVF